MDLQKIELLIEKYLNAETTLQEEHLLQAYFKTNKCPEHLTIYKEMFGYFNQEQETQLYKGQTPNFSVSRNKWWKQVVAAAILITATFFPAKYYYQKQQAQIAYEQTMAAFSLLAINYQKATAPAVYLNTFEQAKTKIYNK